MLFKIDLSFGKMTKSAIAARNRKNIKFENFLRFLV